MIERIKNIVLLGLAVFVLMLATAGEYAQHVAETKAAVMAKTSKSDHQTPRKTTTLSCDIFNSVVQVSHLVFHTDLIFEFDLPRINKTEAQAVIDVALNYTKYYRTLLRLIISPNAP